MKVVIVDYGMGNLASARRAFEECGATVSVSDSPESVETAERIVIPGVGSFSTAMQRLDSSGWTAALRKIALEDRVPVLGLCLGMQLLADTGDEGGSARGLGLIPAHVSLLRPVNGERLPHVGWNEVHQIAPSPLMKDIPAGTDFYFVHSYHILPADPACIVATTPYCGRFASIIVASNVAGVQFHPEKSSKAGFQLIRNFLTMTAFESDEEASCLRMTTP